MAAVHRVAEYLDCEGGWLSAGALARDLRLAEATVIRELRRLERSGAVRRRRLEGELVDEWSKTVERLTV